VLKRILILSLVACSWLSIQSPAEEINPTAKERLGKNLDILQKATKVEAFRVDTKLSDDPKNAKETIAGYTILSKGKEQGKEYAAKLTKVFTKGEVYTGSQARCFLPGVGLRVWKDKEYVDIAICFECTNFVMMGSDGTRSNGAFGGAGHAPMLEVVKIAFPDDKEIQALQVPKK
jgi:hypothetical protein